MSKNNPSLGLWGVLRGEGGVAEELCDLFPLSFSPTLGLQVNSHSLGMKQQTMFDQAAHELETLSERQRLRQ